MRVLLHYTLTAHIQALVWRGFPSHRFLHSDDPSDGILGDISVFESAQVHSDAPHWRCKGRIWKCSPIRSIKPKVRETPAPSCGEPPRVLRSLLCHWFPRSANRLGACPHRCHLTVRSSAHWSTRSNDNRYDNELSSTQVSEEVRWYSIWESVQCLRSLYHSECDDSNYYNTVREWLMLHYLQQHYRL